MKNNQPLADRMRPETIDDVVGQRHILSPDSLLYKMITQNTVNTSIILYGPPGTGKTTIARTVAFHANAEFVTVNAVESGKKDIETVCKNAKNNPDKRTVLFIDEIHRFNKSQQDYLLPFVEQGTVTLIGATTENPYFEVIPALVSRSMIFELKPISSNDISTLIDRALSDSRGLGDLSMTITPDAKDIIIEQAGGDARHALTLLELASLMTATVISKDTVLKIVQRPHMLYDKTGSNHYDVISAFIKSMRGSDPDAVLYYLAKMLLSGEDPKFIARRITIAASEDVSNADPMALAVAASAFTAVNLIGMPEARIILAQAALYVAMAPKSHSAIKGVDAAMDYIKEHPSTEVPSHLRDTHYKSAEKLGYGIGYEYPHNYPLHWCKQQYLPNGVDACFYTNSHIGYEKKQADYQNSVQT